MDDLQEIQQQIIKLKLENIERDKRIAHIQSTNRIYIAKLIEDNNRLVDEKDKLVDLKNQLVNEKIIQLKEKAKLEEENRVLRIRLTTDNLKAQS